MSLIRLDMLTYVFVVPPGRWLPPAAGCWLPPAAGCPRLLAAGCPRLPGAAAGCPRLPGRAFGTELVHKFKGANYDKAMHVHPNLFNELAATHYVNDIELQHAKPIDSEHAIE